MSEELARKLKAFGQKYGDEVDVMIKQDDNGKPVAGYAVVNSVRAKEKLHEKFGLVDGSKLYEPEPDTFKVFG